MQSAYARVVNESLFKCLISNDIILLALEYAPAMLDESSYVD